AEIVSGIAQACREASCALIGGETAEMPGVYEKGEIDLAGTIIGVVERSQILPHPGILPGDVLIGMRSSGPHTNGYSLIRKVFAETPLDSKFPELDTTLGEALLAPHRSYLNILWRLLSSPENPIKALAHLTGGGFIENIPRVLPEGCGAQICLNNWPIPPLFQLIRRMGDIPENEMYRVFNMGIGMVAILSPEQVAAFQSAVDEETWIIGEVISGEKKVSLVHG
ncbi:MAG: phosphoribosylformylglycinamidine cyclo-ligase, partial [Chloroflexi bacterium]